MKRLFAIGGLTVGIFLLLITGTLLWLFRYSCDLPSGMHLPYEQSSWRSTDQSERFRFVDDILGREVFINSPSSELIAELGTPDSSPTGGRYASYIVRTFSGYQCGFNAIAVLQFDFDERGTVIGQKIVYD